MRRLFALFARSPVRGVGPPAGPPPGPALVLLSGRAVSPEAIEAHYRRSPFIDEICVVGMPAAHGGPPDRLGAVVVPSRDALRARRIVNAGELVRFEMEGRAVTLPPDERVAEYRISMAPLPRTPRGDVDREAVARLVCETGQATPALGDDDRRWMEQEAFAPILRAIARAAPGAPLRPDANLELDLGIDSMARVALLAELEARLGVRIPDDRTHDVFTVRDLAAAVREHRSGGPSDTEGGWAAMLAGCPDDDPLRAVVAAERGLVLRAAHAALRLVLFASGLGIRCTVTGMEHLPARGPYLLCPNHQSYLDPFIVAGVLPFDVVRQMFYVGATEYLQHPLTAWGARQVGLVAVDPDAALLPAMRVAAFGLRSGRVLLLFPEGERSIDGTVRRFKKGAAILACSLRVPIVPVAIDGLYDLWPRGRGFAWRLLRPWRRHGVAVRIGPPIVAHACGDGEPAQAIAHELRTRVTALWRDARRDR